MYSWRRVLPAEPGQAGVVFAFTSRRGGVSRAPWDSLNLGGTAGDDPAAVRANRACVASDFDLPVDRLVFMNQSHGNEVAVVDGPWSDTPPPVDALVTRQADLGLAALVADCVPVLVADRRAGVVAAIHAGRLGLLAGVTPRAVAAMVESGASTDAMVAVVGPAVCGRCYEVPERMRAEAEAVSPVSGTVSWTGTPAVDVAAGIVDQLRRAGVAVTRVPGCSRQDPDLYSYRRDGTTGRSAGVVRLQPSRGGIETAA